MISSETPYKLADIIRDTWPQLYRPPDDAPWLNLSPQEIQELREKKHQLTEYGKKKLKELKERNPDIW